MDYASMYGTKKKRAVDPNAPPRPNLLSHEKTLKDTKSIIEQQQQTINRLIAQVNNLEQKVSRQADYLTALHSSLAKRR